MAPEKQRTKDGWDKLDVLTRFLTGGVIALVALFIRSGANDIAVSLETGSLVQRLIEDLTSTEQSARQDVALIALNHSMGKQRPEMVSQIAERIWFTELADTSTLGSVAFQIIQALDSSRAAALIDSLQAAIEREQSVAAVGDTNRTSSSAERLLASAFNQIIFVHFANDSGRATDLNLSLQSLGYRVATAVKQVSGEWNSAIRFFYPEDRGLALQVSAAIGELTGAPIPIVDLSSGQYSVRPGHIEVWVRV